MAVSQIGIDLGTTSILVYVSGKGVVLREPSVVAYDRDADKIRAIGEEARLMLARTPGNIVAVHPIERGVVSDYAVAEQMLRYFIQKAVGKLSFRKPKVNICIPADITEVELKAVEDAAYQAGAREVNLVEKPIAAAIGAGIDISMPAGNMIVDIGGGTTCAAVLSINGIVVTESIKVGGDDFNDEIVRLVKSRYGLMISGQAAEEIKISIGSAFEKPEKDTMDVSGRDIVTGLPKTVKVNSEDTREAMKGSLGQILDTIHNVLEKTPPELASDVVERGIVLVGGGAMLGGLEQLIEARTGINTILAEDPLLAVAVGTGKYMELMEEKKEQEEEK